MKWSIINEFKFMTSGKINKKEHNQHISKISNSNNNKVENNKEKDNKNFKIIRRIKFIIIIL